MLILQSRNVIESLLLFALLRLLSVLLYLCGNEVEKFVCITSRIGDQKIVLLVQLL